MKTKQKQKYKVSYRLGVPSRFQWRNVFGVFNYEDAQSEAGEIERQGYRTVIQRDSKHGLPTTWEAGQSPEDYEDQNGWLILKGGAYDQ